MNAAHIGVTAKVGIVTLLGHVESFSERSAAEKAARRVNNVKGVAEEIEVRLPCNVKHGDEEIASAAVNRLKWDSTVPSGAVKTKVEKGWITLTEKSIGTTSKRPPLMTFSDFGGSSASPTRSLLNRSRTRQTLGIISWSHWTDRGWNP